MGKISDEIKRFFTEETLVNVTSLEEYLTMNDSPEKVLRYALSGKTVDEAVAEIIEDVALDDETFIEDLTPESVAGTLVLLAEKAIEDGYYGLSRTQYDDLIAHGLDREKLLLLLADTVAGEHFESPEAKEILALGDWTGYRVFLDGDGDITGRIVSEKELDQAKQAKESKGLPYSVGESFCIDPDDLPEGAIIDNGILREEDPDSGPGLS